MNIELLEDIGLTKSEINVYLSLLELGSSTTGKIVDKSKASSSKIYEILDRLIQKGLVSYVIKSGVKHFESAPTERILDYVEEKESKIKKQKDSLKTLIPELELKRSLAGVGSETQVFKGMKGAQTSFNDILRELNKGDEYYALGISKFPSHFARFVINFHKKRSKHGIKCKVIVNQLAKSHGEKLAAIPRTKVKYIQKELFTPFVFIIYKDKTLISIGLDEVFIQIKSKNLSDGLRNYADYLWNQDTYVTKGFDSLKSELHDFLDSVSKDKEYTVYGAGWGSSGSSKDYYNFFDEFHQKRIKDGKKARLLFQQGTDELVKKAGKNYTTDAQVKYLPYKIDSPVCVYTSEKKILMLIQKKEPTVITINNQEVAKSFQKNFKTIWDQNVTVLKGEKGMKQYFEELLVAGSFDVIGAQGYMTKAFPEYMKGWAKRAKKINYKVRNVTDYKTKGKPITQYPYFTTKYTLPEGFNKLSTFHIYGKKVGISNWDGKEPTVIIIDDPNIHKTFKKQFELLWNQETRVEKGANAVQNLFEEMLEAGHCDFIGARGYFVDHRPDYIDEWEKRAKKSGFKMRNLVDKETKDHRITKFPFAKTKYTLSKEFAELSVFWIFGNKVAISNWTEEEPTVIIMENKAMYDMYKSQFELLWNKEKI